MRRNRIVLATIFALGLATGGCKSDADAKAEAEAEVDGAAKADADASAEVDVQPRIGGTVVVTGAYRVEILAYVAGRIEAIVMDAKGELVAKPAEVDLSVTLAAEGGAKADVALEWNAPEARFVGEVAADVQLVPGPITVDLKIAGEAHTGMHADFGLAVEASHGGQMLVAGDFAVELVAEGDFVFAYVVDAGAEAHAGGKLDLNLSIGGASDLKLEWNAPEARYEAKVEGGVKLEGKPIVLKVAVGGDVAVAAVSSFHAKAKAEVVADLDADANLDGNIDGNVDAKVKAPDVSAKAKVGGSASGSTKVKADVDKEASAKGSASAGGGKASASGKAKAGFKFKVGG
jgi:hypothetical protein